MADFLRELLFAGLRKVSPVAPAHLPTGQTSARFLKTTDLPG